MITELYDIGQKVYCIEFRCGEAACPSPQAVCEDCPHVERYAASHKVLGIEIDGRGTYYQTDGRGVFPMSMVYDNLEDAQRAAMHMNAMRGRQ